MHRRIIILWLLAFGGFYTIKHMKDDQETNKIVKGVIDNSVDSTVKSEHTKQERRFCDKSKLEMVVPPYKYGGENCK